MELSLEELLHHWTLVTSSASGDSEANFAKSIAKQSRRRGSRPSEKQLPLMQRMVADLFLYHDDADEQLIEDDFNTG